MSHMILNLHKPTKPLNQFNCKQCGKECKSVNYQQKFCNEPCTRATYIKQQNAIKKAERREAKRKNDIKFPPRKHGDNQFLGEGLSREWLSKPW